MSKYFIPGLLEVYSEGIELYYVTSRSCKIYKNDIFIGYLQELGEDRYSVYDIKDEYIGRVSGKLNVILALERK